MSPESSTGLWMSDWEHKSIIEKLLQRPLQTKHNVQPDIYYSRLITLQDSVSAGLPYVNVKYLYQKTIEYLINWIATKDCWKQ